MMKTTTEVVDRRKKICFHCGKACELCCTKCCAIFFCDKSCAKAAWKTGHKNFCNQVSKCPGVQDNIDKFLVVYFMNDDDDNIHRLQLLVVDMCGDRNVPAIVLDPKGPKVPEQVATLLDGDAVQSVFMIGWGRPSKPHSSMQFGHDEKFKQSLVAWVNNGGRLIVHGIHEYFCSWPKWFGKDWDDADPLPFSVNQRCFAGTSHWYPKTLGTVLSRYESDGSPLMNVDKEDVLFGFNTVAEDGVNTIRVASIAWAKYGKGSISYFGDFKDKSTAIMGAIAAGEISPKESWDLNKNM